MEYSLYKKDGKFPCDVTVDYENMVFTVRDSDTTGEVFNSASEVAEWIKQHWSVDQFQKPDDYYDLMKHLESSLQEEIKYE
ncbi:hypothetical protein [Fictibacillus phosphorivorans]|uniref:hypothetical protein n=1 Tax=Fictibacillus phosphorivorans TaxID=1221500 RepID=UPI00203E6CB6|nr:hypothetical protein [Fictibacillus phosphorivorans]MCM3719243.1 hypothetical protein [Fictibacillus phosphorivorans]MCM3776865.1 hypothetical protein [Fictibacillus phosphorivorans]